MKTCKILYKPGIFHILRGGVGLMIRGLQRVQRTRSFCDFMSAEPWRESRIRYLSDLAVYGQWPRWPEDLAFTVADLIKRAVHLEVLHLTSVDALLDLGGPRIIEVLRDLSSHHKLKKLIIAQAFPSTARLLGVMTSSSITHLSLSYDFKELDVDPFPALQSLGPTLTSLDVKTVDPLSLTSIVRCPLLHTLTIQTYYAVLTRVLVSAFPNLLRLSYYMFSPRHFSDEIHSSWRQRNRADLAPPHASWAYFRRLDGDVNSLYAAGLSCPVCELSIRDISSTETHKAISLLDDLSPQMVSLGIEFKPCPLEALEEFLRTAIQHSKNSCSSFSLFVHISYQDYSMQELMVSVSTLS